MPYSIDDLVDMNATVQEGTIGGPTTYITLKGRRKAICGYEYKPGVFCGNAAGMKTSHLSTGRCHWHYGWVGDEKSHPRTSSSADAARLRMEHKASHSLPLEYHRGLSDLECLMETRMLAEQLLANHLEGLAQQGMERPDGIAIKSLMEMVESVSKLANRSFNAANSQMMTAAMSSVMLSKVLVAARKHLTTEQMQEFVADWREIVTAMPWTRPLAIGLESGDGQIVDTPLD